MSKRKTNVLSTLSSFNTLLNDFPSFSGLILNEEEGNSSATITFLLDISKLFGLSEQKLLKWLSSILVDDEKNKVQNGILSVIEESIKALLLLYFNGLYSCDMRPLIPDQFLRYSYTNKPPQAQMNGEGITVRIPSIDMFSQLKFYPLGETGEMFYFDTKEDSVSSPNKLYRSCDFNAWLWCIINYSNESNFYLFPWDNRVLYRKKFIGEDGNYNREHFIETHIKDSQFYNVENVGFKKNIISVQYIEKGEGLLNTNVLKVYGCAETYKRTGAFGYNKTVFDFNADYIYSLKLFNSKTITAQIINSIMGLSGAMFGQISLELNVLIKKIEKTVERVISQPIKKDDSGYFVFSDDEYNEIVNDANLRYNGEYETRNETNEVVKLDVTELTNAIKKIDLATNSVEKEEAILYAIKSLGETATEFNLGVNTPFVANKDIITRFIQELIIQISMQVLSPKVMLLFAINNYFLNNEEDVKIDINGFIKDFWNILASSILKISEIILESLWDLVIGYIRPILSLVVEKLLLETITYYKELLMQLLENCLPFVSFTSNSSVYAIDNVNYADIIPEKTTPDK